MLKNDTDVDRDGLRAIRASGPKHGSLTLNGPGSFVYEPKDGYAGRDSFTYGATDGEARSEPVTVEIQVEAGALHHHRHRRQRRPARLRERRRNLRPRRQRRDPRKAGDDVLIGRAGKDRFVGGTGKDEERQ